MTNRPPQCLDCKFAEWKTTATGRLHPSGGGRCRWVYPDIRLPVSMYFFGGEQRASGGHISRRDAWRQCPQFQRGER